MKITTFAAAGAALTVSLMSLMTPSLAKDASARLLMNWFGQANQSGYWQAQLNHANAEGGLKIETLPGGPRIQTIPQVAAGEAEFGMADADDVLVARQMGAPVKAVFVGLNYVPYSLVYHPGQGIESVKDFDGRTVALSIGASYWEWLKLTYGLKDAREIPVSGDMSLFANDPGMVQQGYSIFLPYRMTEAGIESEQIKVKDLGYRPYDVLFTTDEMIEKHPELVEAAIEAVKRGWQDFIADPMLSRAMILDMNKSISPEVHDRAVEEMLADFLPSDTSKMGCMEDARWTELSGQLKEIGALPEDFDPTTAYDASFVKGC